MSKQETPWTPNMVVARNLKRARGGMTQEAAAELLEPFLGERWSKATFSTAENSTKGKRVRQFTADDLVAFAAAFKKPMAFFLETPPDVRVQVGSETVDLSEWFAPGSDYALEDIEALLVQGLDRVRSQKRAPRDARGDIEKMTEFFDSIPGPLSPGPALRGFEKERERVMQTTPEESIRELVALLDEAETPATQDLVKKHLYFQIALHTDKWISEEEAERFIQEVRNSMRDEEEGTA